MLLAQADDLGGVPVPCRRRVRVGGVELGAQTVELLADPGQLDDAGVAGGGQLGETAVKLGALGLGLGVAALELVALRVDGLHQPPQFGAQLPSVPSSSPWESLARLEV